MSELVAALKGALDYTRHYRGRTFVVKLGGGILDRTDALPGIARQLALLEALSIRIVVVHGGGPQATRLAGRLGIETRMAAGRRVTDSAMLEVAKMVFAGSLNVDILAALRGAGVRAAGISGIDGALVTARRRPPVPVREDDGVTREVDYGAVGDVVAVDPALVETLLGAHTVPVVASLAADAKGRVLNVNADVLAVELAIALGADKLMFLTTSPGLLNDPDDSTSLIPFAQTDDLVELVESGRITGGMRPKVDACLRAVAGGVRRTHILDGRVPDGLLIELFTGAGSGTMIVGRAEADRYRSEELE